MARTRRNLDKKKEEKRYLRKLIVKYDADFTGDLDRGEVKKLLTDLNKDFQVTDEMVDLIIVKTKLMHKSLTSMECADEQALAKEELLDAIYLYSSYLKQRQTIDDLVKTYDANSTGVLEFSEIAKMMTDINKGVPPTDEEVNMVFNHVGVDVNDALTFTQIKPAIAVWTEIINTNARWKGIHCIIS